MFDLGWTEILVLVVVALLVIKPEDLPGVMRAVGKTIRKIKAMARELTDAFEDITDDDIADSADKKTSNKSKNTDHPENTKQILGDDGKFYTAYDISELEDLARKPANIPDETPDSSQADINPTDGSDIEAEEDISNEGTKNIDSLAMPLSSQKGVTKEREKVTGGGDE